MSLYSFFYNGDAKLINYTVVQGESSVVASLQDEGFIASNTNHMFYDGDDEDFSLKLLKMLKQTLVLILPF